MQTLIRVSPISEFKRPAVLQWCIFKTHKEPDGQAHRSTGLHQHFAFVVLNLGIFPEVCISHCICGYSVFAVHRGYILSLEKVNNCMVNHIHEN